MWECRRAPWLGVRRDLSFESMAVILSPPNQPAVETVVQELPVAA